MEEELKKLKKELLKTQEDLEEVRKANKAKDSYYNGVIKEKNAEIKEKDKMIEKQKEWIYELVSSKVSSCPSNELEENCTRVDCTECWIDYIENNIKKQVESKQDFE